MPDFGVWEILVILIILIVVIGTVVFIGILLPRLANQFKHWWKSDDDQK